VVDKLKNKNPLNQDSFKTKIDDKISNSGATPSIPVRGSGKHTYTPKNIPIIKYH